MSNLDLLLENRPIGLKNHVANAWLGLAQSRFIFSARRLTDLREAFVIFLDHIGTLT
jgi:hypothetical protein